MASYIWYRTIQIAREETHCRHYMGYSFRLAARVFLYASSPRQDSTYHGLCYTSRGALAGTRNSSMIHSRRIDPTTHFTLRRRHCTDLHLIGTLRHPLTATDEIGRQRHSRKQPRSLQDTLGSRGVFMEQDQVFVVH